MKSKSVAVVLAILLGGLGIHHFYLGNTKKGLFYLIPWIIFCWSLFVPILLWIIETIEGISLACKSQEDFDAVYNMDNYKIKNVPSKSSSNYSNEHNTASEFKPTSKSEQLLELKKLLDAGVLTEEEFNTQKKKILDA